MILIKTVDFTSIYKVKIAQKRDILENDPHQTKSPSKLKVMIHVKKEF